MTPSRPYVLQARPYVQLSHEDAARLIKQLRERWPEVARYEQELIRRGITVDRAVTARISREVRPSRPRPLLCTPWFIFAVVAVLAFQAACWWLS